MNKPLSPEIKELLTHDEWMLESVFNPEFEKLPQGFRDWRNHVPDTMKRIWFSLNEETRLCMVITATEASSNIYQ